jgi:hypothetical protein
MWIAPCLPEHSVQAALEYSIRLSQIEGQGDIGQPKRFFPGGRCIWWSFSGLSNERFPKDTF